MTDNFPTRVRYKLQLGTFVVTHVERHITQMNFTLDFPGLGKMTFYCADADVQVGDGLPLYTEILAHDKKKAS